MNRKKALCICASERKNGRGEGISRYICKILEENLAKKRIAATTIDLWEASLTPCDGCGRCAVERRCRADEDFNRISDQVLEADYLFFVSPHHAPVPARLCMFLEKVERLAFLYRPPEPSCQPELFEKPEAPCQPKISGKPEPFCQPELSEKSDQSCQPKRYRKLAGIISHTEGGEKELMVCKAMVNDTIANALETVGFKVVPFNSRWNTGISFAAATESRGKGSEYDREQIAEKAGMYVEIVVQTSRTLYAIL